MHVTIVQFVVTHVTSPQQFHDSVESHTRSLAALGKNSDTYGDMLVPITLGKLPTEIKRNLARERRSDEWTLSELFMFWFAHSVNLH